MLLESSTGVISSYSNGSGLVTAATLFKTYLITYSSPPCFKEDSLILCYKDGKEEYRKIQELRKGDLVKTLKHGYVAIDMIGTTKLITPNHSKERCLYRCPNENYPGLFEDLIITGYHSI